VLRRRIRDGAAGNHDTAPAAAATAPGRKRPERMPRQAPPNRPPRPNPLPPQKGIRQQPQFDPGRHAVISRVTPIAEDLAAMEVEVRRSPSTPRSRGAQRPRLEDFVGRGRVRALRTKPEGAELTASADSVRAYLSRSRKVASAQRGREEVEARQAHRRRSLRRERVEGPRIRPNKLSRSCAVTALDRP